MAANSTLTPQQITDLVAKLEYYKYLVTVTIAGGTATSLGPLKTAPKCEPDTETRDTTIYETGSEVQASILSKNDVKLTIETESVDAAITLLSGFSKGDNVLASTAKYTITLVPITATATAKTITFTNAYLQPGLSTNLQDADDPNSVTLTFTCKADASTGKPYTFAAQS